MNKNRKIFGILAVILSLVMSLAGCSNGGKSRKPDGSSAIQEKINIEDISWSVAEGIVDGERYVLLNYTNNTDYTITSFEITFKEKSDITEEEKSKFYSDIQKKFEASDEEMEELKGQVISMHSESGKITNPGESVSNANCYYYGGSYYLKEIKHYDLVEPDIATIKYIEEDKIITLYYDYISQQYFTESEAEVAYQWSQTDLGSRIPKPNVKVLKSGRNDEAVFMFDAYGLSLDQFSAYVGECKNLGYTVEQKSFEGFYSADNADGFNVYLNYDEDEHAMSGIVSAPETENE